MVTSNNQIPNDQEGTQATTSIKHPFGRTPPFACLFQLLVCTLNILDCIFGVGLKLGDVLGLDYEVVDQLGLEF